MALNFTPLPHQERVADDLKDPDNPGKLVYHGVGTGKTLTSINAAKANNLPLLAIVPAALRNNFRKGIAESGHTGPTDVVSYEEATRRINDPAFRAQAAGSLVAFDEAARMGQAGSARSALATDLPSAKKLLLTGTPVRNAPHEVAPLINAIAPGSLPSDPKEFKEHFVETREVPVGFWGRMMGAKPGKIKVPKNLHDFENAVRGKVDFYQAANREHFPSHSESIVEVPMSDKQQAAYDFVLGRYPRIAYKIRHGIPPAKSEEADFQAFFNGPRQVSNHPGQFNKGATDADAAKINAAVGEIAKRHASDPNYRGVAYSAFLSTGIEPLSRGLTAKGIQHRIFTGAMNDNERKEAIEAYNTGKSPVLLISGAGAEGLDLKGTKHIAIMEPHWHEEQINQVRARGIRYKSHAALPPEERHVEVQRFHTVPQKGMIDRLLRRQRNPDKSIDEYLYDRAHEKQALNEPFLRILRGETADAVMRPEVKESAFNTQTFGPGAIAPKAGEQEHTFIPYVEELRPGILLDLDETCVVCHDWSDPHAQTVRPGVLELLTGLKQRGYALVGVTNRSCYSVDQTADTIMQSLEVANRLLGGVLEDVLCLPDGPDPRHKPNPHMLLVAIHRHGIDPENCVLVDDRPENLAGARAIGIGAAHPDHFFTLNWRDFPSISRLKMEG